MKILALEFSSAERSVAIAESQVGLPLNQLSSATETGPRTQALDLVDRVLREAKMEREQIDCIAIGLGPGSYNGIRAALSLGQGWQLARNVKLVGISSAECLAAQARANGWFGLVDVVIDAQRNELYLAGYEISASGWKEIEPLRLATLGEAQARAQAGQIFVGPEVNRWFKDGRVEFPKAATVAGLAAHQMDFVAGEELQPIYLRETNFVKAPPPRIPPLI